MQPTDRNRLWIIGTLWALTLFPFAAFLGAYKKWDGVMFSVAVIAATLFFIPFLMTVYRSAALSEWLNRAAQKWLALALHSRERSFLTILLVSHVIFTATLSLLAHGPLPAYSDSLAQYVQSQALLSGQLTLPSHPIYEFFTFMGSTDYQGRWFTQFPPGHMVMLALGRVIHAPWLINPLLGAGAILLLYAVAREIFSPITARLAAMLLSCSPQLLVMSSEMMNHATAFCFALWFIYSYIRLVKTKHWKYGLLAGLAIGIVFLARPLTAIAVALPYALHGVWLLHHHRHQYLKSLLAVLPPVLFALLLQGVYNLHTSGDHLKYSYNIVFGDSIVPGFGSVPWDSDQSFFAGRAGIHTMGKGFGNLSNSLIGLNLFLFGWPLPSLLAVASIFLLPLRRPHWTWLLLATAVSQCILYMTFFFQDFTFGVRYMHETIGPLCILAAEGLRRLPRALQRLKITQMPLIQLRKRLGIAILTMTPYAFLVVLPLAIFQSGIWYIRPDILWPDRMAPLLHTPALILMPGYDAGRAGHLYPQSDTSPVIYVHATETPKLRTLLAYYPGRTIYILGEDTIYTTDGKRTLPATHP